MILRQALTCDLVETVSILMRDPTKSGIRLQGVVNHDRARVGRIAVRLT